MKTKMVCPTASEMHPEEWHTIASAAQEVGVSEEEIIRFVACGAIQSRQLGGHELVDLVQVRKWIGSEPWPENGAV